MSRHVPAGRCPRLRRRPRRRRAWTTPTAGAMSARSGTASTSVRCRASASTNACYLSGLFATVS